MIERITYPEFHPNYSSRLTVDMALECFKYPDPESGMFYVTRPAGRQRLIVEGETEFLDRIHRAIAPILAEIRGEIG